MASSEVSTPVRPAANSPREFDRAPSANARDGQTRERMLQSLEAEAAAAAPILPVLAEQLRQTVRQVEDAVVSVCSSVGDIATRAREAVQHATSAMGDSANGEPGADADGVEQLINTTRATLEHLMERILKGSELSMKIVYRMDDIELGMKQIIQTLDQVNEVADVTRVLAINAKIQAVHVGEMGKGLGVVADEISNLAQRSDDIARQIREILGKVGSDVHETVSDLRVLASEDMNEVLLSRAKVEETFGVLGRTHRKMDEMLRSATERGEQVATEVANVVMRMQFQDRVSQRIGHVVQALEDLRTNLDGPLANLKQSRPAWVREREQQAVLSLREKYTMPQERHAMTSVLGGNSGTPDSSSSIELF